MVEKAERINQEKDNFSALKNMRFKALSTTDGNKITILGKAMGMAELQGWKDFKFFVHSRNFQPRILYPIKSPIQRITNHCCSISSAPPVYLVKKLISQLVLSKLQEAMLWQNQEVIEEKEDIGLRDKNIHLMRIGQGNPRMLSVSQT